MTSDEAQKGVDRYDTLLKCDLMATTDVQYLAKRSEGKHAKGRDAGSEEEGPW